ncbi:MAG: nucleotide exchange factor GrpE, partial [Chloroflexota bacterium]
MANARKRMERELAEERASANARLIVKILPVLDDFDRAVENLPPELQGVGWVEGILLIQRKLHQILEAEGLREIAAEGQPFDPAY